MIHTALLLSGSVASRTGHRVEQPHFPRKWKGGFGRGRNQSENLGKRLFTDGEQFK